MNKKMLTIITVIFSWCLTPMVLNGLEQKPFSERAQRAIDTGRLLLSEKDGNKYLVLSAEVGRINNTKIMLANTGTMAGLTFMGLGLGTGDCCMAIGGFLGAIGCVILAENMKYDLSKKNVEAIQVANENWLAHQAAYWQQEREKKQSSIELE